ncbi:hypothetical protein JB92DRAFT_640314 [Gautieria morchelliformis]|nr:hypothetical protein JB92DRAFT_640314 [Gautieria morchelliformis]
MLRAVQSTPYTPIFPPPLPISDSPSHASVSCTSVLNGPSKTSWKSYVDSPGAETRIEALTLRMRKAREMHLPLELTLTCAGVKGGDWVGVPLSDGSQDGKEYCLPDTEEEWFEWEKRLTEARDKRIAERKAAEYREKIERWNEQVEPDPFLDIHEVSTGSQERRRLATTTTFDNSFVNGDHRQIQRITSRYFAPGGSPDELPRQQSEPVARASSPLPPAPALDPIPEFCDSFSIPDSPPLLPRDTGQNSPIPDDILHSPSFAVKDVDTSTPPKRNQVSEPVLQLSSPISPPRSLRPLAASQTSASLKRPHESDQADAVYPASDVSQAPGTPLGVKRARTLVEPITPKSVGRPRSSQEFKAAQIPKRLPTLDALLATSARKASSKKGTPLIKGKAQHNDAYTTCGSPSPQRAPSAVPEFSPSQPTYSMFRPQFQSTQHRAFSLPPSPSAPMTSTQPISPEKTLGGTASSGIGFYQSQFNVERRVDQVAEFLMADVWDPEASQA